MSQLDRVEIHFSGASEAPELDDYRPISPLVIAACVAAVASLLAVVHPLLWVVPAVAIVLSLCAIRQVSASQSRYSGRLAAVAALSLASLIGAYAPARVVSLERELYTRAQSQVTAWVSLVQQGRYQEAHQFTMGVHDRFQGPGLLSTYYRPPVKTARLGENSSDPATAGTAEMQMGPSNADRLAEFLQDPVIEKLVEFGKQGAVAHVQNVSTRNANGNVEVTQRFQVTGEHEGRPESIEFVIISTRWEVRGHADWQCHNFQRVE